MCARFMEQLIILLPNGVKFVYGYFTIAVKCYLCIYNIKYINWPN